MRKKIFSTKTSVLENVSLNEKYFKLKVSVTKQCYESASPGQFAHVLCSKEILKRKGRAFSEYSELKNYVRSNIDKLKESQILLRRPFCIHNAYTKKKNGKTIYVFEFLVRIKRSGTELLSRLKTGDSLDILAPIGRPFNYKHSVKMKKDVIIVAGGMGIAPMIFLSKKLKENGISPSFYFGFEEDFSLNMGSTMIDDLKSISNDVTITSNTLREKGIKRGFVTDSLEKTLKKMKKGKLKNVDIYTCGPHVMLKKIKDISEEFNVNCELSLEERMACGIGACVVCVCKTKKDNGFQYKKVCVDGPVFNSKEIIFE
jgi:dihydroorotate dehydrogenase electron transfer subunit